MSQKSFPLDLIKAKIHFVLDQFSKHDGYLVETGSSERSVTHILGNYLLDQFRSDLIHVDCEYSRDGEEVKKIGLPHEDMDQGDLEAKTVYPDIIVHKRGKGGPNILVIEAKKRGVKSNRDLKKLNAYVAQPPEGLGYEFGLLLTIPEQVGKPWSLTWFDRNGQGQTYDRRWD